ncbi:MFS transporter [Stackebrandtia nassauensis]|uniref:Major facilitator superfamily MFS_1 n=1 Tax=Stackebrandtia nassauensis (strain DSM 44728 / CIP 108903 / NRRL B-16338 / NBRC 102104 / LLR-40K-21) TaxID=446470 RepID=D3PTY0_STANL|nr:MFS transporter [Stackebrandtia nassauensis]ADD39738.1 major facilitator superfamily MFS_1 [Stackebrandtia nassauensis DSM 44728]
MTHTPETSTGEKTRWAPIVALAMAMVVITSDMTIAAVTLPSLGEDMDVGAAATAWVLLGYSLPMAAIAIPAGRWADRADLRAVFVLSMTGVAVASVAAALAPTFWVLVVARLLQGFTGALTMSVYMPIVAAAVKTEQRGRAIGYIITIMTLGGLIGAPLGGLVAGGLGWRAVFLLKLPIVAVAIVLALKSVPSNGKRLPLPDAALWRDTLVVGGAVGSLLLAFDRIERQPLAATGLIALAVVLAVLWLRFRSSRPMVAVLGRRVLGLPMLGLFLMSFMIGLISFLLPYYFTDELNTGPEAMGVAMLFFSGAMAPISPLAGGLADRFGALRIASAGAVVSILGLGSMLTLGPDSSMVDVIWRLVLLGVGAALFNGPINAALMAATPADMLGTAGGMFATTRTLASTIGPAVTAFVWSTAGGGMPGFTTATAVLTALSVLGLGFVLAGRSRQPALATAA